MHLHVRVTINHRFAATRCMGAAEPAVHGSQASACVAGGTSRLIARQVPVAALPWRVHPDLVLQVTHMESSVGVRESRQNHSRFLSVKAGEAFVVTECGSEVARLTPSGGRRSVLARPTVERGRNDPARLG